MTWRMLLWTPSDVPIGDYTPGSGLLIEPPTCRVSPNGNCEIMSFRARPDLFPAYARCMVQYIENGVDLFYGTVVLQPNPDSKGAGPADDSPDDLELFEVVGAVKLLEETLVGATLFDDPMSLNTVMSTWVTQFCRPPLSNLMLDFAAIETLITTAPVYYPFKTMHEAMDNLLSGYGKFEIGINASKVFFVKVVA